MAEKKKSAGFSPSDALWSVWGKVQNIKKTITAPFRTNAPENEVSEDAAPQKRTLRETLAGTTPTAVATESPLTSKRFEKNSGTLQPQPNTRLPANEQKRTPIDKSEPASSSSAPYTSPLTRAKPAITPTNAASPFAKSQEDKAVRKRTKKQSKNDELRRKLATLTNELTDLQNHIQNDELEKAYKQVTDSLETVDIAQKSARKDVREQFRSLASDVDEDKQRFVYQAQRLDEFLDDAIAKEKKLGHELDQILDELDQLEKPQAALLSSFFSPLL